MWKVKYFLPTTLTIIILCVAVFVILYKGIQSPRCLEEERNRLKPKEQEKILVLRLL